MRLFTQLLIAFFVVALIGATGSVLLVSESRQILEDSLGEHTETLAAQIMDAVVTEINDNTNLLQVLVTESALRDGLEQSNAEFSQLPDVQRVIDARDAEWRTNKESSLIKAVVSAAGSETLREFMTNQEEMHKFPLFAEVFITNAYGANVFSSDVTTDYRQDDERWWRTAKRDGIFFGDVSYDESADEYGLEFASRLENKQGVFIGIVKGVMSVDGIYSLFNDISSESVYESMHIHLLSKNGLLVQSSDDELTIGTNFSNNSIFNQLTREQDHFFEKGDTGIDRIFSYAKSHADGAVLNFDGFTVITIQAEEFLVSIYNLQRILYGLVVSTLLFTIIISYVLARIIGHPLENLSEAFKQAREGKTPVVEKQERIASSETIELAGQFRQLIDTWDKSRKKEIVKKMSKFKKN